MRSEIASLLRFQPAPAGQVIVRDEVRERGFRRKLVSYWTHDHDRVDAFLFEPDVIAAKCSVLALHQHNGEWDIGKSEVAGLVGDPFQAFGPALAQRGVAVLAPDAVGFESRRGRSGSGEALAPPITRPHGSAEGWLQYYNHAAHRLVCGELLMTKVLSDVAAAVGVLRQLNPTRSVGVIGHSYGGNVALFAGALDERVAFTCASGAACSFRYKLAHAIGLEMALVIPGFAARYDMDDLMRCIAPRRVLVVSSTEDPYSADAEDLVRRARPAFDGLGAGEALAHLRVSGPHALDAARFHGIVEWVVARTQ